MMLPELTVKGVFSDNKWAGQDLKGTLFISNQEC